MGHVSVTEEAAAVLRRGLELAGLDPSGAGVRIVVARALGGGTRVQTEFAAAPEDTEETVTCEGVRLFVPPTLYDVIEAPLVALDPQHDTIVIRPA